MSAISTLLDSASARLKAAGVENPRREARLLLAQALDARADELLVGSNTQVGEEPRSRVESFVKRRAAREPLAYITGEKEFWSLPFAVGPGVLVPRPETETLIEEALRQFPDRNARLRILDLGTGSGCLLLTLLHLFPNAAGIGIDVSEEALGYAMRNAKRLDVEQRCGLRACDWESVSESGFDLVVSNPPYIVRDMITGLSPEVARYEPYAALDGGIDGLMAYRSLVNNIERFLAPDGVVLIELGAEQAEDVSFIFQVSEMRAEITVNDLSNIARCLVLRKNQADANSRSKKRLEIAA